LNENMDVQNLVKAWIKLHYLPGESDEREREFWASTRLYDLVRKDPEAAWRVVLQIIQTDSSDQILSNVGAGPLEDLLVYHGERFISRIEARARTDDIFKKTLSVVWKNAMSDDIWGRIKAVAGPSW
jgi:hypothetical protein